MNVRAITMRTNTPFLGGLTMHACLTAGMFLCAVLIVFAAGSKFVDLSVFANDLKTWDLVPGWALPALTFGVPSLELLLGGAWLLGLRRSLAAMGMLLMLAGFTGAFIAHLFMSEKPSCSCLGLLTRYYNQLGTTEVVLIRNGIMLAIIVAYLMLVERDRPASLGSPAKILGENPVIATG